MKPFTINGVIVASLLSAAPLAVHAERHNAGSRASATAPAEATKMCRAFEPAAWDNQGFMIPCEPGPVRPQPASTGRCPMFSSPMWDNMGFTVPCKGAAPEGRVQIQRTCPVFEPATWDNMGFRKPC